MIAVSTHWNAARHAGWTPAVRELAALGHPSVALAGAALHSDAAAVRRAVRESRGEIVALFVPVTQQSDAGRTISEGLVSPRAEKRSVAVLGAAAAGRAALESGTRRVVVSAGEMADLDPAREARILGRLTREGRTDDVAREIAAAAAAAASGRDRFVEALCRSLFELARAVPDAQWCLETPSRLTGLPRPEEMEAVFGELPRRRIGYWHDTAHAARIAAFGAVPAEEWLARLGARAVGVTMADFSEPSASLPPGAGLVDWAAVRAQLTPSLRRVLRLDPSFPATLLRDAVRSAGP